MIDAIPSIGFHDTTCQRKSDDNDGGIEKAEISSASGVDVLKHVSVKLSVFSQDTYVSAHFHDTEECVRLTQTCAECDCVSELEPTHRWSELRQAEYGRHHGSYLEVLIPLPGSEAHRN